jgi:hypothetical protein
MRAAPTACATANDDCEGRKSFPESKNQARFVSEHRLVKIGSFGEQVST